MTGPTKADLRYAINRAEKALDALHDAHARLRQGEQAEALSAPLERLWEDLWRWTDAAIVRRDSLPAEPGK